MNIINKYIWLIDTVSRAGYSGITFEEINRKYQYADELSDGKEYNVRTFHNYRRDIAEIFGIDILCDTDGYRYYIADDKELCFVRIRRGLMTIMLFLKSAGNDHNACYNLQKVYLPE